MFADPQTITIATVAKTFARTSVAERSAVYTTADGEWELTISHQPGKKRVRRMVKLARRMIAADPLTAVNSYQKCEVWLVVNEPEVGFVDATILEQIAGLLAFLSAGNQGKVLASEF